MRNSSSVGTGLPVTLTGGATALSKSATNTRPPLSLGLYWPKPALVSTVPSIALVRARGRKSTWSSGCPPLMPSPVRPKPTNVPILVLLPARAVQLRGRDALHRLAEADQADVVTVAEVAFETGVCDPPVGRVF